MIINQNEFSLYLETISAQTKKPILDVIVEYCEENFLDVLDVIPYLNPMVIAKLESNFITDGLLPKRANIEDLF